MIRVGDINSFIVMRKSDLGYMLMNKNEQILLHYNQCKGQELEINSTVECFVQYDSKGRLSATLEAPAATVSKAGWVEVVETNARLGVFISINTFKDVLISKDDLPDDAKIWPEIGDRLLVVLFTKNNHLNARMITKQELLKLNPAIENIALGAKVDAHVVRFTPNAVNAITDNLNYVYVSSKQFRGNYRLGQQVEIMIIGAHDDELVGSLNKVKEELVESDETIILAYLRAKKSMPFTAKTEASEIEEVFHMSRKAFKRALGDLYKKRLIYFKDDETFLVE